MIKLHFDNLPKELERGTLLLASEYGFELAFEGMSVSLARNNESKLKVNVSGGKAHIEYAQTNHFFRGLGYLLEALQENKELSVTEEVAFDTLGVMFDVSQGNAVITPWAMEKVIQKMAIMGINMLMLYMEDSFVVEEEPFFGYMRPKYTQEDLRAIDDYAHLYGIEVIPAIQTLAHLIDVLKWGNAYGDITDCADILLVGEDRTYEFIERMLVAVTKPLRSKRVHIGMDEAFKLGRGNYQNKHGVADKADLMRKHLLKVCEVTEKLGLEAMMWSDMFFNTPALSGYGNNFDPEAPISKEVFDGMPDSLGLVFWDYNQVDEDFYTAVIKKHQSLEHPVIFAGGVYNCHGFGVNNGLALETIKASLSACRGTGLRQAYLTVWGDDGTENNIFSLLFAFSAYAEQAFNPDASLAQLKQRFAACTGGNYDDFMNLRYQDEVPGVPKGNPTMSNPTKFLCWQNALLGLYDNNVEGLELNAHYEKWTKKYAKACERNPRYASVFVMAEKLCAVLAIKSELGINLRKAYLSGDREGLKAYQGDIIPELIKRYESLRESHRDHWFTTNKAEGWEIIDLRYGTQLNWLDTAIYRIKSYLDGSITEIEELENERICYPGNHRLPLISMYHKIASASRISQTDNWLY